MRSRMRSHVRSHVIFFSRARTHNYIHIYISVLSRGRRARIASIYTRVAAAAGGAHTCRAFRESAAHVQITTAPPYIPDIFTCVRGGDGAFASTSRPARKLPSSFRNRGRLSPLPSLARASPLSRSPMCART